MILYNIILFHLNLSIFLLVQFIIPQKYISYKKLLYDVFSDKNNIKRMLIYSFKYVFIEEALFRLIIPNLFCLNKLYTSIIFGVGHIINYIQLEYPLKPPIIMSISQIIYTFFLRYLFLHELNPIMSLIIHQYNNIICIMINYYMYQYIGYI
jgi:hypothetical protein